MQYIGLLDCNNFFVSCERLFRPDLRDTPTIVLSSNDGCVVARSQEVKVLGIPMGVPHFQVKEELKDAEVAVFSGNITLYRDISARVMSVLKRELSTVQQYSIDESFFTITADNDKEVHGELTRIKKTVEREVGVPVSVGAGLTKTIAKYASEKEKRESGVCVLTGEKWNEETNHVLLHMIWGVGGKTSAKMRSLGIKTVADFLAIDSARVVSIFGVMGTRLRDELSERPVSRLSTEREVQKSITSTRSFKNTTNDTAVLKDSISYHISHAAKELRKKNIQAQSLQVLMKPSRHGDWILRGGTMEVILARPTNDTRVLLKEAVRMVEQLFEQDVPYKKTGVVLSQITPLGEEQLSLFDSEVEMTGSDGVMETIDALNQRFGEGSIHIGSHTKARIWKSGRDYISPHYTTKWSDIQIVKA